MLTTADLPIGNVNTTVNMIITFGASNSAYVLANGASSSFPLGNTPNSLVLVYVNGLMQIPNVDFTVSGNVLTFNFTPQQNSSLFAMWGN